ncbi:MAG: hypothetical protein U1E78_01745 [Gammaproteobacteria bacterium]
MHTTKITLPSYRQRVSQWSSFLYRFAYDATASLVGAIPRGFLSPFEFLTKRPLNKPIIRSDAARRAFQFAFIPLVEIVEFYIQKPFANLAAITTKLISFVAAPLLALFREPPSYPDVTVDNLYFTKIVSGPFGQVVNRYAPFLVWGALCSMSISFTFPELSLAFTLGNMMLEGMSAFAFAGSLFGLFGRFMYEHGRTIFNHLQQTLSVLKQRLSGLKTAIIEMISFCKTVLTKLFRSISDFTANIWSWVVEQFKRLRSWFNATFESAIELIRKGPKAIFELLKDKTIGAIMRYGAALMTAHQLPVEYGKALMVLRMKHTAVFTEEKAAEMMEALRKQAAEIYRENGIQAKIDFLTQALGKLEALKEASEYQVCKALGLPLSEANRDWEAQFIGGQNHQTHSFTPSANDHLYPQQMIFRVGAERSSRRSVHKVHDCGENREGNNPENSAVKGISSLPDYSTTKPAPSDQSNLSANSTPTHRF